MIDLPPLDIAVGCQLSQCTNAPYGAGLGKNWKFQTNPRELAGSPHKSGAAY